ncbi:hypothetical protein BSKO_05071 [Bryopsis sp. KO-2023]|nr:hypothetical protein BSKO_05071 [Bryopsis sp. KO-2023]
MPQKTSELAAVRCFLVVWLSVVRTAHVAALSFQVPTFNGDVQGFFNSYLVSTSRTAIFPAADWSPIHHVAATGKADEMKKLLELGAVVDQRTELGETALHMACRRGFTEVAKILLDEGADIDAATEDGYTPLHEAATFGSVETVQLLLEEGADPDATNQLGRTAGDIVCSCSGSAVSLNINRSCVVEGCTSFQAQGVLTLLRQFSNEFLEEEEEEALEEPAEGTPPAGPSSALTRLKRRVGIRTQREIQEG